MKPVKRIKISETRFVGKSPVQKGCTIQDTRAQCVIILKFIVYKTNNILVITRKWRARDKIILNTLARILTKLCSVHPFK